MTQLHTLQHQFQQALLHDQPMRAGLLSARGVAQFGIYRHAYRARLQAALRDNYEVLPQVMGDEAFDALALAYISAHPSGHYSLRWYGHALADFMAQHEALVDHSAMVDLARMEWALRHAFDAAPAEPLTAQALASTPAEAWAQLQFGLHPSVQLLSLQWAVGPVWHALKEGQDEVPAPDALEHYMLVWRRGMNTQWKSLTFVEADFVQCLQGGHSFAQVCETLAQRVGEDAAAATAAGILGEWLAAGAITGMAHVLTD
jgi:Putative DNA-binding domain